MSVINELRVGDEIVDLLEKEIRWHVHMLSKDTIGETDRYAINYSLLTLIDVYEGTFKDAFKDALNRRIKELLKDADL